MSLRTGSFALFCQQISPGDEIMKVCHHALKKKFSMWFRYHSQCFHRVTVEFPFEGEYNVIN